MSATAYNPLEKLNLAQSIKSAILANPVSPLASPQHVIGAGVYALYYKGSFEPYAELSSANDQSWIRPIYVGKATPKGGRIGGFSNADPLKSKVLAARLKKHSDSITSTANLDLNDFVFRSIILDEIWIPLGENILIETFQPLWNVAVGGFGINDPGKGRLNQKRSAWDVLHPGRAYADKLKGGGAELQSVLGRVVDYFQGRPLRPIPNTISQSTLIEE